MFSLTFTSPVIQRKKIRLPLLISGSHVKFKPCPGGQGISLANKPLLVELSIHMGRGGMKDTVRCSPLIPLRMSVHALGHQADGRAVLSHARLAHPNTTASTPINNTPQSQAK